MNQRTKWTYCIGATGRDAAYALVSMYLILYVQYTMNLTTAQFAAISGIMVVCMVWDAVNDLMMGIIIENTHMKMGKFKPWILMGAILNAFFIIALFSIRPSGWGFVLFFGISYLLWGMTYTMNDIAYWGMLPSLSKDAAVRNSLVTIMSVFICIGQFVVAGVVPTVIAGNAVNAYRVIAIIVAFCFIAFQTLTALGVTENEREDNVEKLSLKDMYHIFARNDQLIYAGIGCLLFNIGQNLLIVFGVNFFYVEYGYARSGDLVFLFTVMYGLGTLISQASYAFVTKHFTRKKILTVATLALTVLYLSFLSLGYVLPKNVILLNAIGFFIFFFHGLINMTIIIMVNNTIEYDEFRYKKRHEPVISAVRSFSVKLAGGVNQLISALILLFSGIYYKSQEISQLEISVGQGKMTSEEALTAANGFLASVTGGQRFCLRLGMCMIPLAAIMVTFLLLNQKYTIDEKEYDRLLSEIEKSKA